MKYNKEKYKNKVIFNQKNQKNNQNQRKISNKKFKHNRVFQILSIFHNLLKISNNYLMKITFLHLNLYRKIIKNNHYSSHHKTATQTQIFKVTTIY